jgi:hypothetical protein
MKLQVDCPACRRPIVMVLSDDVVHIRAACERPRDHVEAGKQWDRDHPHAYGGAEFVFPAEDGVLLP